MVLKFFFLSPDSSLSPIAKFPLPFLHRIFSFRRRHRPAKHPPLRIDLGLLISDLERRRTVPEESEPAPEPRNYPTISPPIWSHCCNGDLPAARPCTVASSIGQIEAERRGWRTPSACVNLSWTLLRSSPSLPCRTSDHLSCHQWASWELNLAWS